ncbi:MAG: hypothetical protein SFX73_25465 [Kofleriaceae bacterium]|nr:hypothetical protein [Kofleriaceae bacterium]
MRLRPVVLLALIACEPPAPPPPDAPPPTWVYAPPPPAWPLGTVHGRLGRSHAPQPVERAGIAGSVRFPLRQPTPWAVPGDGPARAVIYGLEGVTPAVEVIDVDAGQVLWRGTKQCAGPVVGVASDALVCADANGVRGVSLDGEKTWRSEAPYVAMTDDRVVVGPTGEAVILDAGTGDELSRVKLPAGVIAETVIASCGDAGRELFVSGADGKLARIADAKGGSAITWSVPVGTIDEIDACVGDSVLVRTPTDNGASWIALARTTGAITGRVDGVRGIWRARDGSEQLELSTSGGVAVWPRDLSAEVEATMLPALGPLLAARGELRLVRATPLTAVVLDKRGVRAYLPLASMGAVLGERAIVAGSWSGSAGEQVRRIGLPPHETRAFHLVPPSRGVAAPAELRDLPELRPLEEARAIAKPDTGKHAVAKLALDPREPAVIYAAVLERAPSDASTATLARADLATRQWTWQRTDGCGPGLPLALALTDQLVVCAARGDTLGGGTVRATSRAGAAGWQYETDTIDGIAAAGDTVIVFDADRAVVLDATTGHVRGHLASDDGGPVRATPVALENGTTLVVVYQAGRVVARWPRFDLLPVWSLAVDGVVRGLSASGDGVLVAFEDGDAYRLAARTGERVGFAGLGLGWRALGDLVTGEVAGDWVPGVYPSKAPGPPVKKRFVQVRRPAPPPPEELARPRLWTPIAPPPSAGPAWQLAVYELSGALRARNDYAITEPDAAHARGPVGSPFVVTYGAGGRGVLVLDPRSGDPVRRAELPEGSAVFSTVVDGAPVAGAVVPKPLRIIPL